MSIHKFLNDQIQQLRQVGNAESRRQRIEQLPSLTQSLSRTQQQAAYTFTLISLIQDLFQEQAIISQVSIQSQLQEPLQIFKVPEAVLSAAQASLTGFQTTLDDCREHLQIQAKQLEQQLDEIRALHIKEIEGVRGLLRVPDLLQKNTNTRDITTMLTEMENILTGTKTIQNLARSTRLNYRPVTTISDSSRKWRVLYRKFSNIRDQLSFERLKEPPYGLSEASISVIQLLVDGQQITLSQISPQTMNELHTNFRQFLNQVELRFIA
jgi:hypothetical protein